MHLGAKVKVDLDIVRFFPSLPKHQILRIWRHFFHFPEDVAQVLAALTTLSEELPQGAATSNHLANLVFFDKEPGLVEWLKGHGIRYTRYIDDVTLSSASRLEKNLLSEAVSKTVGMFHAWGLKRNKRKFAIVTPRDPLLVNNLSVSARRVAVPKANRRNVRAAIAHLRQVDRVGRTSPSYKGKYDEASGRAAYSKRLHPRFAESARFALRRTRPLPSDTEIARLRAQVSSLSRRGEGSLQLLNPSIIDRLSSRIGQIKHARPREAARLQAKVRKLRARLR